MLISIDPGLRVCGYAVWRDGVLVEAGLLKSAEARARGPVAWRCMCEAVRPVAATELAIEFPQVYVRGLSKGDPNDLIELAAVVGALSTLYQETTHYLPRRWKGQVPKDVMQRRIEKKLTRSEQDCIVLPVRSLAHNVWDAIGIGLYHLGRL